MAKFRDFKFTQSLVTAIVSDLNNGRFLWIAYTLKNGTCLLNKVSAHDVTQVYFSVPLAVSAINKLFILGDNIYACVSDSTYVLYQLSLSSPFTSQAAYTKAELGITEEFITGTTNVTNLFLLTPGSSGNAQIVNIDDNGSFVETIDGIGISNAISITVDSDDIWVVDSECARKINEIIDYLKNIEK